MFRLFAATLGLIWLTACGARHHAPGPSAVVTIVPGCPTEADGRLSFCLWRRVIWASLLYEEGRAERFITSGSAVYNRYTEAEALKTGMVALGVPADLILTETQALHTDENMGYSLLIAQELGVQRLAVASDRNQAFGGCMMLRRWGHDCTVLALDRERVHARRLQPLPDVVIEPVPADGWQTLEQREQARAQADGARRRPASIPLYVVKGVLGLFGLARPPAPPGREPSI